MNEAQFPEFVHEKIHPRARCANHFREHLLRHFGKHLLGLGFLAIVSEQQKSSSQPFLARIEKLIHQILLDSNVPREHIRHEAVGESMFSVQHANHASNAIVRKISQPYAIVSECVVPEITAVSEPKAGHPVRQRRRLL